MQIRRNTGIKENEMVRGLCKTVLLPVVVFFITYSHGKLQEVFSLEAEQTHKSSESETDDLKKQLKQMEDAFIKQQERYSNW